MALAVAACGSSGPSSSTGTTRPHHATTSTSSAGSTTTASSLPATSTTTTGPMTTASLPVIVCQTTSGAPTTTTSLPASESVSVPPSQTQSLAVYTDPTGVLMLVGPMTGWTCNGNFGADGSGTLALTPVGTSVPAGTGTTWHLSASSPVQAIVAIETGASSTQGAELACSLFGTAAAAVRQDLGQPCPLSKPAQEKAVANGAGEVGVHGPRRCGGCRVPLGWSESRQRRRALSAQAERVDRLPRDVHAAVGPAGPLHCRVEPLRHDVRLSELFGGVAHRLDVVAVGVTHEGP